MSNQLLRICLRNCFSRHILTYRQNDVRAVDRLLSRTFQSGVNDTVFITYVNCNVQLNIRNCCEIKFPFYRLYSMASTDSANIDYNQLIKLNGKDNVTVIDVREKEELKETGEIPGSFNIPLGEVAVALSQLSNEDFKKRYGFQKPTVDDTIIFSCRSGKRSLMAQTEALKAGFKNSLNFTGGWLDWEKNTKNV